MKARLRRIALFTKSALLTMVIHGLLLTALFAGWWWPFSQNKIEPGSVTPIQARAISAEEIQQQVEAQKKKIEERQQIAKNLEELKIKQQQEKKKLEALEIKNQEEARKQQELEAQRKRAEQKRVKEIEEKKKKKEAEAEKNRKDAEKKKKLEAEKKRKDAAKKLEAEKKRKEAALNKKIAEQKREREQELKDNLEKESELRQQAQTKIDAATALSALGDRIKEKFKNNWVRPSNSTAGLIATIRVHLSPSGDVLSANVVKTSGNSFFDRSAETAVRKASPLPFPPEPEFHQYIKVLDLEFNPDNY